MRELIQLHCLRLIVANNSAGWIHYKKMLHKPRVPWEVVKTVLEVVMGTVSTVFLPT